MNFETLGKVSDVSERKFPSRLEALAAEKWAERTIDVVELDKAVCQLLGVDEPVTQENRRELPVLTAETRERLKKYGWPDTVLDSIGSEAEAKIYEDANVKHEVVNGKDVLVKQDIDPDQKDIDGKTNLERMKDGKAPLDKDGRPIELHHIGQNPDSPLIELTRDEHRGEGNDSILHNKTDESKIDREAFGSERAEHWKAHAEQIEAQRQA
ncbi:hypothetical protein AGMMS49960_03000 [Betaproteobacteria bacterium]|nr:hypothetical protein AGMMS49543_01900 [Betaproteobacteria bacterium]GHT98929.1 hypothetical protein AGMMS49960_03000 [Betaproteobacteria bacterium]GHU19631.1 hypothetical protein AGMMS50243_12100 [Betaproteobacteria bacterium]